MTPLARYVGVILASFGAWLGCLCARPDQVPTETSPTPVLATPSQPLSPTPPPTDLRVFSPAALKRSDLKRLESLDIALAPTDTLGQDLPDPGAPLCDDLGLAGLATGAPALTHLRLSGCSVTDLPALPHLTELELANLTLTPELIEALAQSTALRRLSFVRVEVPAELRLDPLRNLAVEYLGLVELQRDSELRQLFELWARTLTESRIIGDWAGHDVMLAVANATAMVRIELRGTRVGNYSLHQLKPLSHLRDVFFAGETFNDTSPLYLRDLALESFRCACPKFGDGGLHALQRIRSLRRIALDSTRITQEGLLELRTVANVEELIVPDLKLGTIGLTTLAQLPHLHKLVMGHDPGDPDIAGLGLLRGLQSLHIIDPLLDDRVASALRELKQLQVLDLSNTRFSDEGLAALGALLELRRLNLAGTRVTNVGFSDLTGLKKLEVLDLSDTDTVDAAIPWIAQLTGLKDLRLKGTLITDASIDILVQLPALERLDVTSTAVTDRARFERLWPPRDHVRTSIRP